MLIVLMDLMSVLYQPLGSSQTVRGAFTPRRSLGELRVWLLQPHYCVSPRELFMSGSGASPEWWLFGDGLNVLKEARAREKQA